ncbi:MAG: nucleotidyltransferase domain-containing protein [Pyrobaculum sp.]
MRRLREVLLQMHAEAEEWLRRLCEAGYTVVLFGSRARGDARIDSDWDVVVLGYTPPEPPPHDLVQAHFARPEEAEEKIRAFNTIFLDAFYEGKLLCGDGELFTRLRDSAKRVTSRYVKTKEGWMMQK